MSETMTADGIIESNAALMDRHYDLRAIGAFPGETPFKYGELVFGQGLIEDIDGQPSVIADIPLDLQSIDNEFARLMPRFTYNSGCIMIAATLTTDTPHELTAMGLLDDQGNLLAAFGMLPIWITPTRTFDVIIKIHIDRSDDQAKPIEFTAK